MGCGIPIPAPHWPFGLAGLFGGLPPDPPVIPPEERVRIAQDTIKSLVEDHSELWRQAMYQYLYSLGHRVPTGDLHRHLIRLAQKEKA